MKIDRRRFLKTSAVAVGALAVGGGACYVAYRRLAPGLDDSDAARARVFETVMARLEAHVGRPLRERIAIQRSYAMRDFEADYGAFKGNAYGMANTLRQTGPFKPRLRSSKVSGLYFAGQLTVPGPGMPPSLVSGELSAKLLLSELGAPASA